MKAKFAVLLCMLLCLSVAGSVTAYAAGSEIESVIIFTPARQSQIPRLGSE